MQKFRTLLLQFYRPLFLWNLVFSIAGIYDLLLNGIGQLIGTFFIKLVGYAAAIGFQYYFSAQVYFYYRNAGYAVRKLYGYAFLFDFVIYLALVYLYIKLMPYINA